MFCESVKFKIHECKVFIFTKFVFIYFVYTFYSDILKSKIESHTVTNFVSRLDLGLWINYPTYREIVLALSKHDV